MHLYLCRFFVTNKKAKMHTHAQEESNTVGWLRDGCFFAFEGKILEFCKCNSNSKDWKTVIMNKNIFYSVISFFFFSFAFSFDLVTLGAMSVTLMFQRPPFLPQTRTVWTPNNNFLVLDQVTMSREESQPLKCDIRSVVSPYPLVLPYPLPRYTASCEEKGPVVPELQVWKLHHSSA